MPGSCYALDAAARTPKVNPRYDTRPPRRKTLEDQNRAKIHEAARAAAVAFLKELITEDANRLIKKLTPTEVNSLVEQTLAGYHNALTAIERYETENWAEVRRQALKELDIFA